MIAQMQLYSIIIIIINIINIILLYYNNKYNSYNMLFGFCKKMCTEKVDICITFFFKLLINLLLSINYFMSMVITKNNVKFTMKNRKKHIFFKTTKRNSHLLIFNLFKN